MKGLAREIIFAIGDNMKEGLEPLLTKTLAPSLYQVYLHADDYDRLRTIFRQVEEEARVHLDQKLAELEELGPQKLLQRPKKVLKRSVGRLPRRLRPVPAPDAPPRMRYEPAAGEWHIRFQEDPNGDLEPGEVEVVSEMAVGELVEYGTGSPTQKIKISTTRKLGSSTSKRLREAEPRRPAPPTVSPQVATASAAPSASTGDGSTGVVPSDVGSTDIEPQRFATASASASEQPTAPVAAPLALASTAASGSTSDDSAQILASLDYDEQGETKSFELRADREEVLIGRGALDVWVDLRLRTPADVSRRHALIRRDDRDRFWIQDLSQYGTWVDGKQIPKGDEIELGDGATIDLAAVAKLRFRRGRGAQLETLPPLPPPPPPPALP